MHATQLSLYSSCKSSVSRNVKVCFQYTMCSSSPEKSYFLNELELKAQKRYMRVKSPGFVLSILYVSIFCFSVVGNTLCKMSYLLQQRGGPFLT